MTEQHSKSFLPSPTPIASLEHAHTKLKEINMEEQAHEPFYSQMDQDPSHRSPNESITASTKDDEPVPFQEVAVVDREWEDDNSKSENMMDEPSDDKRPAVASPIGCMVPGEKDDAESSDPLQSTEYGDVKDNTLAQDVTLVVEEGDIVDSSGRLLFPDVDTKPSPTVSRRASQLHLDLKPNSPQPWELVDPPPNNNDRPYYSPDKSRKFDTMQNTITRPLIPKSSYYFGPPPADSAYGTPPVGHIGIHHPREILRVERDYTGGELIQFAPIYPLELEGRVTPTQFLESVNAINELLISAHSQQHAFLDNILALFSLQISRLLVKTHFEKEMQRLEHLIHDLNIGLYNPVGLNILSPGEVAFLYLEIEYYVITMLDRKIHDCFGALSDAPV